MKQITLVLELRGEELDNIEALIEGFNADIDDAGSDAGNTHGKLDPAKLVTMLLEDVAMCVSRAGSWEGANMAQVLSSHGYN
jgi:hypothetical protein